MFFVFFLNLRIAMGEFRVLLYSEKNWGSYAGFRGRVVKTIVLDSVLNPKARFPILVRL